MAVIQIPSTTKGKATRERLLAVAMEQAIASQGHVELARVARQAGVVQGVVHRYFGSKSGLISALVDDYYDRFHKQVLELYLNDAGDWAVHERLRLRMGIQFHYEEPLSAVLHSTFVRDPVVARKEAQRIDGVIDLTARGIIRAQRRGELPRHIDPELAGAAMFGAMQAVLSRALNRLRRPSPEKLETILWQQVAASVGLEI
ncbi:MAG: TetR/AcrR family transcriptional regulator [Halieaceae bacterium]|jgi:AcrR family transcriptional regulator|nr:TetR/AcrR family transcriptional regulator [Halieaceae bacterium]